MIKFRIRPKVQEGERCKFGKVFTKCQNYRFFDIFLDILYKMKESLGQEHVKWGLLSFQGKIEKNVPDFPGKKTVFPVLTLLFTCPSLKSGFSTHTKIIFLKSAIIGLFAGKIS